MIASMRDGQPVRQRKLAVGGRNGGPMSFPPQLEREASLIEPPLSNHGTINAKHAVAEVSFDKKLNHLASRDALCGDNANLLADRFDDRSDSEIGRPSMPPP